MDKSETIESNITLEPEKHLTHTKWIVWYHNPSDKNWGLASYKDIIEISSIEDFWVLKNTWGKCLPKTSEGMFFLMRKTDKGCIYPQWEDKNNRKGGYWSFKVTKDDSENAWFELMMFMIGECITNNPDKAMEINGISVSPKKNFCILKIWNNDNSTNSKDELSSGLKFLNMEEVLYSSHENNIEKDTLKFKKRENYRNGNDRGGGRNDRGGGRNDRGGGRNDRGGGRNDRGGNGNQYRDFTGGARPFNRF